MLEVSALSLGYGGNAVLAFEGMRLGAGDSCLLAGKSGSGKTTLLYALAGVNPVMAGNIYINGCEITALSEVARDRFRGEKIGIVYQSLHLVKSLTVLQNVMLAGVASGKGRVKERAVELLVRLGLGEKLHVLPEVLSQGQAQRVAIARAVLLRPVLLLADEPTSSLDDDSCEVVIRLLKEVAAESGSALVIATHDGRVKRHFSNVIAVGGS
jgi:putative ABC transport system ATP-binding protein